MLLIREIVAREDEGSADAQAIGRRFGSRYTVFDSPLSALAPAVDCEVSHSTAQ
jgi:hypothetical protein